MARGLPSGTCDAASPVWASLVFPPISLAVNMIDPVPDARIQHVQWHGTTVQNFIMEGADIEMLAQYLLGMLAQLLDAQFADRSTS